jgi:predicted Zn-dependent protease
MRWLNKEELGVRLERFPLLRQMLFEFWFRVIVLCGVGGALGLGLALPKIWVTSPKGFLPVIKVSGLDLVQAWSLQRTARQAMAAGKYDEAAHAWRSAFANNPANPRLARGALENYLRMGRPGAESGAAVQRSLWLLRLTQTNATHLELAARVFERNQLHDFLLDLLEPRKETLSPALEAIYLRSLFHQGQMDEFAQRWEQNAAQLGTDRELALYEAAYRAGWGPVGAQAEARREVASALSDPARQVLANQLLLRVALARSDPALYAETLKRLEDRQADRLLDHIGYWQLLMVGGDKAEAVKLARAHTNPPGTWAEAFHLAQAYAGLGLRDDALGLLEQAVAKFSYADRLWVSFAQLLMEAKRWEDLRALALRIRQQEGVRDRLAGFSHYLEGRAELGLDRRALAEAAFQKVSGATFENRALGLATARSLLRLKDASSARDLLLRLEEGLEQDFAYWQLLFAAANELKDTDLMLRAITEAYRLRPNDPATMNNYAAALIIHRQQPDEAIKLTLQLRARNPKSTAATMNHAFALLLNHRAAEAEALFRRIDPAKLSPPHASDYYFGLFEASVQQQRFEQAWQASAKINPEHLYANQARWLEEAKSRLPPKAGASFRE